MTNLIDAIEKGTFQGLGRPDRIIETMVSKLFFFGDKVYKVYKQQKYFFGDFTDRLFRHEFYHDDFIWNNTMAPDIYLKLGFVKTVDGSVIETTHDQSEDYFILMNKIDDSCTLFEALKQKSVTKDDLKYFVSETFIRVAKLTEIKKSDIKDIFNTPYVDLEMQNLETTRDWVYMASGFISKKDTDRMVDFLEAFIKQHPFFKNFDTNNYIASVDDHAGNILYQNNKLSFIDSMPPMRIWRAQCDFFPVSRPATDIEIMMGKEYADAMYSEYEKVRGHHVEKDLRAYFSITAALIRAPYFYVLKEPELAQKFWDFACAEVEKLK